jgi:hypothetical protein
MKNQFEWEIYSPITQSRDRKRAWLLLVIIIMVLCVSFMGNASPKRSQDTPDPYKEYPQELPQLDMNKLPGKEIKNLDKQELIEYLDVRGFRRLQGKNIVELRRIWLAYMYDNFFYTMHKKTNLPISVIYAFFIIEATNNGIESNLMAKALNPGGIKYRGTGSKVKSFDDCFKNGKKIPCSFQAFNSYDAMVQGWADVLNLPRYKKCKRFVYREYNRGMTAKEIVNETCKCFYKSGYHTSNLWKVRSNLSTEYWTMKASFPIMEY